MEYIRTESVQSFIAGSQAEYLSSLAIRFFDAEDSSTLSQLLASLLSFISAFLTRRYYVQADYTILTHNASITSIVAASDFSAALAALPSSFDGNKDGYRAFVRRFGTHVVVGIDYGARLLSSNRSGNCLLVQFELIERADTMNRLVYKDIDGRDFISEIVGGNATAFTQNGVTAWQDSVVPSTARPLAVHTIPINDARLVSEESKRLAIDAAIDDLKPFSLPRFRTTCSFASPRSFVALLIAALLGVLLL